MRASYVAAILLILLTACSQQPPAVTVAVPAPSSPIRQIYISYEYMGWGVTSERFRIVPHDTRYVMEEWSGEDVGGADREASLRSVEIPALKVNAFTAALKADPVALDDAVRMLVDGRMLKANKGPMGYRSFPGHDCDEFINREYGIQSVSLPRAHVMLASHFREGMHTDDYPQMKVAIYFQDGTTRELASDSQHALMLPWKSEGVKMWNPAISDSLSALLPDTAEGHMRTSRAALPQAISRQLMSELVRIARERPQFCH